MEVILCGGFLEVLLLAQRENTLVLLRILSKYLPKGLCHSALPLRKAQKGRLPSSCQQYVVKPLIFASPISEIKWYFSGIFVI